mmetsp:Transcript_8705/g.7988  ORF Transcript_8705/g.7988 Transcript_8705/m.7988 type:complete len:116 (+) Transcript_8705:343-690(+)
MLPLFSVQVFVNGGKLPKDDEAYVFTDSLRKVGLDNLEELLKRKNKPYICGDHMTIADLKLLFETNFDRVYGRKDFSEYPLIEAWMKTMSKNEVIARNVEGHTTTLGDFMSFFPN